MNGKIIKKEISETIQDQMAVYSYNINILRAFPDVRDGLKPVQRRVMYSLKELGLWSNKNFYKVAAVSGDVTAKYHPHGTDSVDGAIVHLAQSHYYNYPLIKGKGNMGYITGDSAAASRYIECKMDKYGELFLDDLDKQNVDWRSNYDNRLMEPIVLPVKLPNLLVNGCPIGIGQAYTSTFPSHNLNEVVDMTIKIIKNPDISLESVAKTMFPDFPTGGTIINKSEIWKSYCNKDSEISIKIRGNADIEDDKITIIDIPYMTTTNKILDEIQERCTEGISDIIDMTNKENGVKIIIKIKKGFGSSSILSKLYKMTSLESTFSINMNFAKDYEFRFFDIKELFTEWIDFRKQVLKRKYTCEYSKNNRRIHIIEALLKILGGRYLNEVIQMIKKSKSKKEVVTSLMERYNLTELQADSISEMKLYQLSALNMQSLKDEKSSLEKNNEEIFNILSNSEKQNQIIIDELKDIKKKFGRPRLTQLADIASENIEDTVLDKNYTVILTKDNMIKKFEDTVKATNRGTIGQMCKVKEGDYVKHMLNVNNKDTLLCFTTKGKAVPLKVYNIPEIGLKNLGKYIGNFINLPEGEEIVTIMNFKTEDFDKEDNYLMLCTRLGNIKFVPLNAFKNLSKPSVQSSLIAIALKDSDSIVCVDFSHNDKNEEIIIVSKKAKVIRCNVTEIPILKRTAMGVSAMKLEKEDNDEIINAFLRKGTKYILTITENGLGKKNEIDSITPSKRYTKGKIVTKVKDDDNLKSSILLNEDDTLVIFKSKNVVKIDNKSIGLTKGNRTYGCKLTDCSKDEEVVSLSKE